MRARSIGLCVLFATAPVVHAGSIWQWTHQASGGGTANVFDSGPPESDFEDTTGLDDPTMAIAAIDRTRLGSLGARALVFGRSSILGASPESFGVSISYTVGYFPSVFAGGDNPGGEAEGSLSSVIEFVAPANDLRWLYRLNIDTDPTGSFIGSTDIILENLTRATTFQGLSETPLGGLVAFEFGNSEGDLIRLTTEMSGAGGTPAADRSYDSSFRLSVIVPEPGTLSLLLISVALVRPRRRRRAAAVLDLPAASTTGGVA
jgi:hypothetical protein